VGLKTLLFSNPVLFLIVAFILLYSIIAHEVAHGWVALLFGDDTAKRQGRLTLNPFPHIDPIGILMLFLVGFGWAKPVPVNYNAFQNSRLGLLSVSMAGCLVNILIAFTAFLVLRVTALGASSSTETVLMTVARINILLGAFNLIPIPPLDGSKVLMSFLPPAARDSLSRVEPFGFFILVFFLFTGLLNPVIKVMQNAVLELVSFMVGLIP
jgi:Zn-dependent protease